MSLYPIYLLLGCLLYAAAIPNPEPKNHVSFNPAQPPPKPNPFKVPQPSFNPRKDYGRPLRVRRFTDLNQANFNNHNQGGQPKPEWELRADTVRDKFGHNMGQVSLDKHGKNYDVGAQWKQNLGESGRHVDRTWVGINGQVRF